ncbi:TraR/DksA family transcriptional regulator [bacterium]|nr:TraR/DksA family transcriptional regulator [bacterium]MCB1220068.1 TraR/DksA family transcriptional regulator [bacterium]UNM07730.1 MAG: TraR/DksA family transcriptional regulator [Planctomycetales bacterium]
MAIKEADLPKYQKLLEDKKAELTKQLTGLQKKIKKSLDENKGYDRSSGDPDSDYINESSELVKDELMIRNLEKTLRDIEDALNAIEEGYYGICQKTGKSIQPARLQAIPWARYCIEVQEEIDAYERG